MDFIDESEVLTPADNVHHIDKHPFKIPFVCGCRDLGEALRRISEGAVMIRTKGEAGTGDIVEAVKHARLLRQQIATLQGLSSEELYQQAKALGAPVELVREAAQAGRLPVVTFAAGGIATPADAALMMHLGMDGVFVGSVAENGGGMGLSLTIRLEQKFLPFFLNPAITRVAHRQTAIQTVQIEEVNILQLL